MRKLSEQCLACLQGKTRFSDPARADQRHKAVIADEPADGFLFFFASNEAAELKRNIMLGNRFCNLLFDLDRLELTLTYLFVKLTRLRLRVDPQLFTQDLL